MIIIVGFILVVLIGFIDVLKRRFRVIEQIDFANVYRNKFIDLSNKFFQNYDRFSHSGNLDNELYVWLTMNVNKIQSYLGSFGIMSYKPAYQNYMINNYQIIINTLPKFREGKIEHFDVASADDCLLRYIGHLEEVGKETIKNLKNPIIWFREGIKIIISYPIIILSWFGIFSRRTVGTITDSPVFKIIAGLIALVTLASGLVTIFVGYDQTVEFLTRLFGK